MATPTIHASDFSVVSCPIEQLLERPVGGGMNSNVVQYDLGRAGWEGYHQELLALLKRLEVKSVCEVGGGANPAVSRQFLADHGIRYTLLDISQEELNKAPPGYSIVQADICDRSAIPAGGRYDFVFTKMLAEHVRSGRDLHRNIYDILAPGGYAFHFFPTLFAFPFIVNWLIPERLSGWLLDRLAPRDKVRLGKFPAFYSWCVGPTRRQLRRLGDLGYEVVYYRGLFGADAYYSRVPFGQPISTAFARFLVKHPVAHFTAFSMVLLKKPL